MLNINYSRAWQMSWRREWEWDSRVKEITQSISNDDWNVDMWVWVCVCGAVIALLWTTIKIEFIISDGYSEEMLLDIRVWVYWSKYWGCCGSQVEKRRSGSAFKSCNCHNNQQSRRIILQVQPGSIIIKIKFVFLSYGFLETKTSHFPHIVKCFPSSPAISLIYSFDFLFIWFALNFMKLNYFI